MRTIPVVVLLLLVFFASCEEGGLLIETDISERAVTLTAPVDGSEVPSTVVFFDWTSVQDASSYEIQLATPNFDNASQLLLNTVDSVTTNELELPVGSYEWRVKAMNGSYETNYASARFTVVPIVNFSDNVVVLSNPQSNQITNVVEQELNWQTVSGASIYRIQIIQNGTLVDEQTTDESAISMSFPEGESSWQVRAENGISNTLYSSNNIIIDTVSPNIAELLAPKDNSMISGPEVSFEWSREVSAGTIEKDSVFIFRDIAITDLVSKEEAMSPYQITLENDTYYWFVTSYDAAGNQSEMSSVFSFILE